MGWKLTYAGQDVTDDDATVGEATTVSQIVGRTGWDNLEPSSAPDVLAAWCVIAMMRSGKSIEDAVLVINQTPMRVIASAVTVTEPSPIATNGSVDVDEIQANLSAMQSMAARLKAQQQEG